jgi:Ubiquitin-activating enzyme active site
MYGITENRTTDEQYIRTHLTNVIVPDFITADNIKIAANEEEAKQESNPNHTKNDAMDYGDNEVDEIWNSLPRPVGEVLIRAHGSDSQDRKNQL